MVVNKQVIHDRLLESLMPNHNVFSSLSDFPYLDKLVDYLDKTYQYYMILSIEPFVYDGCVDYFCKLKVEDIILTVSFHLVDIDGEDVLLLAADYCVDILSKRQYIFNKEERILSYYEV